MGNLIRQSRVSPTDPIDTALHAPPNNLFKWIPLDFFTVESHWRFRTGDYPDSV